MVRCGVAKGPCETGPETTRYLQVQQLYEHGIVDLGIHIPLTNGREWKQWAMLNVREGGCFFARAIHCAIEQSIDRSPTELLDLVRPWRPILQTDSDEWARDPIQLRQAIRNLVKFCKARMDRRMKSMMWIRKTIDHKEMLHGTEIWVTEAKEIHLEYKLYQKKMSLSIHGSIADLIPKDEDDLRFVYL
jgi:hypothetical protein